MNLDDDLRSTLRSRAKRVIRLAHPHLNVGKFFVAGSSIATREISDIDVYPVGDEPFTIPDGKALAATKNAVTIANDPPIQFCRYKRATLEALIESFDFAHVQAGAEIADGEVVRTAWTDAFVAANACRTSQFTGSEYPLSSAIRIMKYHKRGELTRGSSIRSMLDIITAIVDRGFKDYDDFKDQLDAVDLGLTPENLGEVEKAQLMKLFELLRRNV